MGYLHQEISTSVSLLFDHEHIYVHLLVVEFLFFLNMPRGVNDQCYNKDCVANHISNENKSHVRTMLNCR